MCCNRLGSVSLVCFSLGLGSGLLPRVQADEPETTAEGPKSVELSVTAKAVETPVLKYRLHPTEPEIKDGDAAPILLRLPWEQTPYFSQVVPTLDRWVSLPLDHPDWKDSDGVLPHWFYSELRRAAFRRDAHWSYPIHEEPWYDILLPDIQGARSIVGYGLSARIRYHIRQGELDQAREGIAVGIGASRQYAKTPFVVTQLVVAAIQRMMLDRVEELVAAKDSPNLYWALSTLPRPLVDLRPSLEMEVQAMEMTVPGLANLDEPRSRDQWRAMAERLATVIHADAATQGVSKDVIAEGKRALAKLSREELPKLSAISSDEVAAMSDEEVSLRWFMWHYRQQVEQASALQALPPREAMPHLVRLKAELADFAEKSRIPASATFDPVNVFVATWSVDRRVDALRLVEAIRHFAAKHEGKLPDKLDEIKDLPLPVDLFTGEPFDWKAANGIGVLAAPKIPGVEHPAARIEYRIRVR